MYNKWLVKNLTAHTRTEILHPICHLGRDAMAQGSVGQINASRDSKLALLFLEVFNC
jgi:hypothetical protein